MDEEHRPLERFGPVEQTRVGCEMHHHVQAQRNDTQQGMDPPDEKLMAEKKVGFGGRLRAHLRVLTGYESTTMQPLKNHTNNDPARPETFSQLQTRRQKSGKDV